jgi:multidrug efflux pump subunit AcrA (membrane-fusion protein)
LKAGDPVRNGVAVARLQPATGDPVDVVSPVAGQLALPSVQAGAHVAAGDVVAVISPGEDQVWEALRGLYLVGMQEDLEEVERFARPMPGVSERTRQQATLTATAIRRRAQDRIP